ncbi:MAG: CPBP family intramembrane metalloprotease, partial [Parachlamydiaceae bacterium]|nr:CPBP family intramembrane metalloprotease [Parachlamydiaceae bacterium]
IMAVPLFYYIWIFLKEGKWPDFSIQKPDLLQLGWLNVLAILATAFALWIYSLILGDQTTRQIWGQGASHKKYGFISNFLIGSLTWLLAYPLVTAFGQLIAMLLSLFYQGPHTDQVAIKHLKSIMDSPWLFPITVIEIVTIVPAIEEFIFRGLLQTWLKGKLGVISAILITSLIFALFHFSFGQGIDNIELVLSLFILSCFLGFVRERQQSLWASIGLHSTFNAISIVFLSKLAIIFLL